MKVTQFETTKDFFLRPYELKPTGGKMGGADIIEVAENPNEREFEGFGVAVTGSSGNIPSFGNTVTAWLSTIITVPLRI